MTPELNSAALVAPSTYPGEESLFDELFAVEDRHFWFRARNTVIAAVLQRLPPVPGLRALEIGCGTGNTLRLLEQFCGPANVVGMDLFGGGFRYARQRTTCPLVQGDMHQPPFRSKFDLVAMLDVLEHQADDATALRATASVLRPGGKLLLTTPACMSLWSYADEFAGHRRRYRRDELEEKLCAAGFQIEYLTYYMAAMFPMVWLKRRLGSRIRSQQATARERFLQDLRVVSGVNGILRWMLEREALAIRVRLRLPFGASLLALAAKPR